MSHICTEYAFFKRLLQAVTCNAEKQTVSNGRSLCNYFAYASTDQVQTRIYTFICVYIHTFIPTHNNTHTHTHKQHRRDSLVNRRGSFSSSLKVPQTARAAIPSFPLMEAMMENSERPAIPNGSIATAKIEASRKALRGMYVCICVHVCRASCHPVWS